jgi:hypothetical protein
MEKQPANAPSFETLQTLRYLQANKDRLRYVVEKI